MKGAGNVPGMADFFKNAGFDAKTGQFVYNPQAQQPAAQPAVQTPGATATNT